MLMVQVDFSRGVGYRDSYRTLRKTVWVEEKWKLKPGQQVSFKGETDLWTVAKVYKTMAEMAELDKKWGLDLPKSQRTER